jgi:hypothetical protein
MVVCRAAEVTETQFSAMKSNESTYSICQTTTLMFLPIPGKSLPEMSRVGRAGMPLPNAITVVAKTQQRAKLLPSIWQIMCKVWENKPLCCQIFIIKENLN